jgi:iron complex outermembrane receptor protein
VHDVLRLVPGLEVVNLSPFFPSITGRVNWNFENNTHQVLVDGREYKVEALGFAPWALVPVFLDDIERIEVIRGPASALYGADAMGGVISITTQAAGREGQGRARLEMGEAGSLTVSGRGAFKTESWSFSLHGGLEQANRWLSAPRSEGKNLYKARSTAEYRWSEDIRLFFEGSTTGGHGIIPTVSGNLDTDYNDMALTASFKSPSVTAHLYYNYGVADGVMDAPLTFAGVTLARITRNEITGHTLNGDAQWTIPLGWDPLMLIVGGGARLTNISSPQLLDAETFGDINSDRYHEPGLDYWETRVGGFAHAEYAPFDWFTLTGGLRADYNTNTGAFLSPRLAAVLMPFEQHFLRLSVARAFRKPTSWEALMHVNVEFPEDGIFRGNAQDQFREFMTRVAGNVDVGNEKLTAVEIGYVGKFLDKDLSVSVDLYYNLYQDLIAILPNIVPHDTYLVDLEQSSFQNTNYPKDHEIFGAEISLRYRLSRQVQLIAAWVPKAVFRENRKEQDVMSPRNMITLGGRFSTSWGLLGSLYVHARSELTDRAVENPDGILEESLQVHIDHVALVLARLGYWWKTDLTRMEAGVKMFLPVSPFSGPLFRYHERGGGVTPFGVRYGGDQLTRVFSVYLKSSF